MRTARARSNSRSRSLLCCVLLASVAPTTIAAAYPGAHVGPVTDDEKAEAKKRFDKAIGLYEEKDYSGALAEFRRAYELTGNLVVLYNIALVHDALGQYVQAEGAIDEVLATNPDPLKPEQHARAVEMRARAHARIGTIELVPTVKDALPGATDDPLKGAIVELDGIEVGRWPLPAPLRTSIGDHVVGLVAAGFAPSRKPVSVAGEANAKVPLELTPMAGKLAQLRVVTAVPKAQIIVDGQLVGTTPLPTSISIAPGKHVVELKRAGYATASTVLELSAGGIGEAKLDLHEDPASVATLGAKAQITSAEPAVSVAIDGVPRDQEKSVPLPPGPHHLHVEKTGFESLDREFEVVAGTTAQIDVALEPTPETRAAHESSISSHRLWGTIGVVSGIVVGAAGVYVYSTYGKNKSDIEARAAEQNASTVVPGACSVNPATGTELSPGACTARAEAIERDRKSNNNRFYLSIGLAGVGLAAVGLGIYSFVSAPSSSRFKDKPASTTTVQVTPTLGPGLAGLSIMGSF